MLFNNRITKFLTLFILLCISCYILYFYKRNVSRIELFTEREIPKIIWSYWDSDKPDPVVETCMRSWAKHNPDYKIIIIDKSTIQKYCDADVLSFKHADSPARISDFIRLIVLKKNGGVWIDASILCTEPLKDILPTGSFDFFGYNIPNFTTLPQFPVIESWFLVAPANSPFMSDWCDEFLSINSYPSINDYLTHVKDQGIDLQNIAIPEYLTIHIAVQKILQTKTYNIITLDANLGPYKYLANNDWDSEKALTSLCGDSAFVTPLIKFRGDERKMITEKPELICAVNH